MYIRRPSEYRSVRKTAAFMCIFCVCCMSSLLYRDYRKCDMVRPTVDASLPAAGLQTESDDNKRIVIWTRWNAGPTQEFTTKNQPNWLKGCAETRCLFLTSREKYENADALMFVMLHFSNLTDIPRETNRRKDQYYLFYMYETADNMIGTERPWYKSGVLGSFFNLTMSYRSDADIYDDNYLGEYNPHIMNLTARNRDPHWFQGKSDVLWLVSHCKTASKREDYVKSLSLYLKIDIYGRCGSPDPCENKKKCADALMSKYKFYLSFENSICKEYVTEKLMRALNQDVVPIVLGGANYSSILPESAFINVENFESPKKLAEYLKKIIENQTLYERHLEWKYPGQPIWHIPEAGTDRAKGRRFCKLCDLLHKPVEKTVPKSYSSIQDWFFDNTQCREPHFQFKNHLQ